ncbi:MAG: L,D-transpeptidase family protein [Myxococcales bacterium]|nr:L,D-transpeptidase family protein [Myxococcales bacterium]
MSRDTSASARVQGAHERRDAIVGELFSAAGLTFPPRELLLRAYKEERELEVWASDRKGAPLTHVTTYKICALSGRPGPKKLEGDGQVPEGFYTLDYFNKRSAYHLSMRVSYPNHRDRKLRSTGSAIMIHGDCVSIGCLAMSDERIEELWVMVTALPEGQRAAVHLFPGRDLDGFIARAHDPELAAFWRNLAEGEAAFERDKRPPKIGSTADGTYTFR